MLIISFFKHWHFIHRFSVVKIFKVFIFLTEFLYLYFVPEVFMTNSDLVLVKSVVSVQELHFYTKNYLPIGSHSHYIKLLLC